MSAKNAQWLVHGLVLALGGLGASVTGCGGAATAPPPEMAPLPEREAEPDDGVQVEGITGSMTKRDVNQAMERRQMALSRCFAKNWGLQGLYGAMRFHFRVAADGSVLEVYPTGSTLGNRGVEDCLVQVVRETKFPRPRGNAEAEFEWHLIMDPPDSGPRYVDCDQSYVAPILEKETRNVLKACDARGRDLRFQITAYLDQDGHIQSLSAVPSDPQAIDKVECLLEAVRSWPIPPPQQRSKVTFVLR